MQAIFIPYLDVKGMFYRSFIFICLIGTLALTACSSNDPQEAFDQGDYETAYRLWLSKAKLDGDPEAQNYLGIHYYLGLGVERDIKKAAKWYEKAAKQNYPNAQRNYGDLFYQGLGVKQDYYNAYVWYFAASQQGNDVATRQLDTLGAQNKLSPNQQMHAKLTANAYIEDPKLRFKSHDTYIKKGIKKLN